MRVEAMGSSKKHFLEHFDYKRVKKESLERGVNDPKLSEFEAWAAYLACPPELLVKEWLDWKRRSPLRIGYKQFMDHMIDDLERLR